MEADAREQARRWMIRLRASDFEDWLALTEWLERDDRHNDLLEEALELDRRAGHMGLRRSGDRLGGPAAAPSRRRPYLAGFGAVLAVAAATWLGLGRSLPPKSAVVVIRTRPGERQQVRFPDGSEMDLNGGSRVDRVAGGRREVTLVEGQASFRVRHDASRPFTVMVGGKAVQDVGTRFDLLRSDGLTQVEVAEGAVVVDPASGGVRLGRGEMLSWRDGQVAPVIRHVEPADVGAWREGTLVFHDAALTEVADGLSRQLGVHVTVADRLGANRFSGAIVSVGNSPEQVLASVSALLDVRLRAVGDGWRLLPRHGPAR